MHSSTYDSIFLYYLCENKEEYMKCIVKCTLRKKGSSMVLQNCQRFYPEPFAI